MLSEGVGGIGRASLALHMQGYLDALCVRLSNRHVGSPGNQAATDLFGETLRSSGLRVSTQDFRCLDWEPGEAELRVDDQVFQPMQAPAPFPSGVRRPWYRRGKWRNCGVCVPGAKSFCFTASWPGSSLFQRIFPSTSRQPILNCPGALDNAAGVSVLMGLAELLKGFRGNRCVELLALNGEDYCAASGQAACMALPRTELDGIGLAVNLDLVGYREGRTGFSFYRCPDDLAERARQAFLSHSGLSLKPGPERIGELPVNSSLSEYL